MSTNAIFIAMEEKVRAATILKLTGERKKKIELQKLEDSGKALIAQNKPASSLLVKDLDLLLKWYGKSGKDLKGLKVTQKRQMWNSLADKDPPVYEKWSDAEEAQLIELQTKKVDLSDTALGREQGNIKQAAASLIRKMSKEERNEYLERLKEINDSLEDDTPEPSA